MGPTTRQALEWLGLVRPAGKPRQPWYGHGPAWVPVLSIVGMLLVVTGQLIEWHATVVNIVIVSLAASVIGVYLAMIALRLRDRRRS